MKLVGGKPTRKERYEGNLSLYRVIAGDFQQYPHCTSEPKPESGSGSTSGTRSEYDEILRGIAWVGFLNAREPLGATLFIFDYFRLLTRKPVEAGEPKIPAKTREPGTAATVIQNPKNTLRLQNPQSPLQRGGCCYGCYY